MATHPDYPGASSFTVKGNTYWRYRKNGRTVALRGQPHSPGFADAYQAAIEGRRTPMAQAARPYRYHPKGIRGAFPRRIENMLLQKKIQARSAGRAFELDEEWLIAELERVDYRCVVTGIPFEAERLNGKRVNPFAPSIDRIDCSRGYTKDNVRLVLTSVNCALSDFGLEHFDQIVAARVQQIVKERIAA